MLFTRENLKLSVVAAGCLLIGLGGPAVAAQVRATFADNAGAVDGFSAVGAGATVTQRKGKLVATNPTTGRLPDNLIATAPNAAKLGGFTPAQTHGLPLTVAGATLVGGSSTTAGGGASLPPSGNPGVVWTFTVPPDYKAGSKITLDLVLESFGGSCSIVFDASGFAGPVGGQVNLTNHWAVSGDSATGAVAFPAGGGSVAVKKTLTWSSTATAPGQFVSLTLTRNSGSPSDTCAGEAYVWSALVRY